MEPLPDVAHLVKEHTQRAYILAQHEQRPPGYSVNDWALVLMGNDYAKLEARYAHRLREAQERLPAAPANPPEPVAAKARELYLKWFTELAQLECENAVYPLRGGSRSVTVMNKAKRAVQEALLRLREHDAALGFGAKLTMNKDGSFTIRLTLRSA